MLTLAKDLSTTISIHAPTRGATKTTGAGRPETTNFNPRSHEGSDPTKRTPAPIKKISIHAPTRGATLWRSCRCQIRLISIHAPTRGATQQQGRLLFPWRDFNPRSHEGSDHVGGANNRLDSKISIHAPTRGATPGSQT